MRATMLIPSLSFMLLTGCGLPYIGVRQVTPDVRIAVTDVNGKGLKDYDLYVYRCIRPGSQLDRVISLSRQAQPQVHLRQQSELGIKRVGYAWLAPDFAIPYEPRPYWVACVNKDGFKSRRWSLNKKQGDPVTIRLIPGSEPGVDYCEVANDECNPCRSYEYFFHTNERYRHPACKP